MAGRRLLKLLGTWSLGFFLFSACVGMFLLLVSWHSLPPKSVAIVREIWVREGPLFGPSALPFRVRVVQNAEAYPKRFFVQPLPFGVVEEVLPLDGEIPLTFRIPLWRKDTVTGNPYDGSVAFVGEVRAQLAITDYEQFAQKLDPLLVRYVPLRQIAPLSALSREELSSLRKREDLLREILRRDFAQRMIGELGKISQSLHFKLYFAEKVLEELPVTSPSEGKIAIWKHLDWYPWYKLEPQEMGKIIAEDTQIFEKIMTYLRRENQKDAELEKLHEEIKQYFSDYIARNPQSYSQELWNFAIERITESRSLELKPETLRFLTYQYVHTHPTLLRDLLQSEEHMKNLTVQYGVAMKHLDVQILEDLAIRYPELLR